MRYVLPVALAFLAGGTSFASAGRREQTSGLSQPPSFDVLTPESSVIVDVRKRGLLSPILHDHHLRFGQVRGMFLFEPSRPEAVRGHVVVNAGAVTEEQSALSPDDRRKVEAQVRGREILDAGHYPTIRFVFSGMEVIERSGSAEGSVRGTLVGTLELRGRAKPIRVPIAASYRPPLVRARGATAFRQSDFGIEPYSTALGTIGVRDRVEVRFDLLARTSSPVTSR